MDGIIADFKMDYMENWDILFSMPCLVWQSILLKIG